MSLEDVKKRFVEEVKLRAFDDKYIDKTEEREILQIADYLHDVGADINMLRYYQSVLKSNEVQYLTNEQALDLGIAVLLEETGQIIEPLSARDAR